jgi:hypothetical protein
MLTCEGLQNTFGANNLGIAVGEAIDWRPDQSQHQTHTLVSMNRECNYVRTQKHI